MTTPTRYVIVEIGIDTSELERQFRRLGEMMASQYHLSVEFASHQLDAVFRAFVDPLRVAIDAGITEADVRSAVHTPRTGIVEVRLWNHRRIEIAV